MPQGPLTGRLQHSAAADLTRQWVGGIGLAALVGFGYFLAAAFSVRLVLEPEGVAGSFLRSSDRPWTTRTMAGFSWGDSRDYCDPSHHQGIPWGPGSPLAYATGQKP
jgi:hypothetical protein